MYLKVPSSSSSGSGSGSDSGSGSGVVVVNFIQPKLFKNKITPFSAS